MFVRRKFRSAFTIIELLVVLAVTALLMGILVPCLAKALDQAKKIQCMSNLRQINLAVELYLENNKECYPCLQDPMSTDPFYWLWMGRGWRSLVMQYLGGNINESNPSVLFCPADKISKDRYESTSYAYSMAFYHTPAQINSMTSYTDNYMSPVESIAQKRLSVLKPANKILIGEWLSVHEKVPEGDSGWWCWNGSRNFLFADGSVQFINAKDIRPANDGNPNPNLTKDGVNGTDWPK